MSQDISVSPVNKLWAEKSPFPAAVTTPGPVLKPASSYAEILSLGVKRSL
jgi:hypothetical protein